MSDRPEDKGSAAAEADLFDLLRGHAPDPEAFRAGIDRRIRDGEREAKASAARPGLWERVASFVPLDPVTGTAGAGVLAKSFGGKLLPAALLMPALILAATVGAFSYVARDLRRSARRAEGTDPAPDGDGELAEFAPPAWMAWLPGALLAVVIGLRNSFGADILIGLLVVTMGSIAWLVRGLRAHGTLRRSTVSQMVGGLMGMIVVVGFIQTIGLPVASGHSAFGFGASVAVMMCGWTALELTRPDFGKLRGCLALGVSFLMLMGVNGIGVTHATEAGVRSTAERIHLSPDDPSGWDKAAACHRALAAVGAARPDHGDLRERLLTFLEGNEIPHPVVRSATIEMGLVAPEEWLALDPGESAQLTPGYDASVSTTDDNRHRFTEWAARTDITGELRADLRRRIFEALPTHDETGALAHMLACVRGLEAIGLTEDAEQLRAPTAALLEARFVGPGDVGFLTGTAGGFSFWPDRSHGSRGSTLAAVELMARFGVPEGVDIHLLRSYLRIEARASSLIHEFAPSLDAYARAALFRLETQIGMPERSWLGALFAERLLIAAVLTVLLAVLAVWWSPSGAPAATDP